MVWFIARCFILSSEYDAQSRTGIKEETREKIIAAGQDAMSRKGYCATTMADIAAQTGVTRSALYLYFKNKDALDVEIVKTIPASIRRQRAGPSRTSGP